MPILGSFDMPGLSYDSDTNRVNIRGFDIDAYWALGIVSVITIIGIYMMKG